MLPATILVPVPNDGSFIHRGLVPQIRVRYFLQRKTKPQLVTIHAFKPVLGSELPCVNGLIDYRQQCEIFKRIDQILSNFGLEDQFIELAIKDHRIDIKAVGPKSC